ncbi:cation diffusion facilitator family transporter [Actinomyces timonensis]|uniref:cation diffusion facilitator family transporter n=1 Tax=Actinomyces timonensis TaxID=1288391 RepID=UPI0002D2F878|nr:cation diffusion facilitator family transporter [Actinomyces timonensis]
MAHDHSGGKAIIAALSANVGIALTKAVAWLLTGSSSMLAESVHSLADSGNQAILLLGGKRAKRAADEQHQFGYGRSRYLAAFIVSIVLFTLGGLFALYEAWEKFSHPHAIDSWKWVPVAVLAVSIGLEGFSLRTALHEAHGARGQRGLLGYIRDSRAPEIPLVLLEDIGALLGLVFALGGVSMTLLTGDGRWDAVGSAAIGLLLVVIAMFLAFEMSSLLLGESATPEHRDAILAAIPGGALESVVYLRTIHTGPETLLVAAKVAVPLEAAGVSIAESIDAAEARVREALPGVSATIFLEPDIRRA